MRRILLSILMVVTLTVTAYGQIKVSYVGGEAYFKRNNVSQRITYGMEIKPGDLIITGSRSFVALLFDDNSVHKVTANTEYEIKNYQNTESSRFQVFNIIKGKIFSFVSKTFKKSDIKFLTPTAVVGVRGTSFVAEVNQEGTTVYMIEGQVDLFDAGSGSGIPVRQGEKGKVSEGKVDKSPMQEQDYEEAAKDVPVSLAEVNVEEGPVSEGLAEQEAEEEKNLVRSYVDESTERIDEQRQEIAGNRVWDYQSQKAIGNYRITQVVKKEANNQIKIVNHTINTGTGRQNSLDLGIIFEKSIPDISDVSSGEVRNINQIDWRISVAEGGKKDELFFSKNYKEETQMVAFNAKEGTQLTSRDLKIKDSNVRIPSMIKFKIDNQEYAFNLNYDYIRSDGSKFSGIVLDRNEDYGTYEKVLGGDVDTQITVKAILPEGAGNVLGKEESFKIILINDFLFPLFNDISS